MSESTESSCGLARSAESVRVLVLTRPMFRRGCVVSAFVTRARYLARAVVIALFGPFIGRRLVNGPLQVELSLVRGLRKLGWQVDHNPFYGGGGWSLILVPNGLPAFHQALELRTMNVGRILVAGPNLCNWTEELELEPEGGKPDLYIQPCEWARDRLAQRPPQMPCPIIVVPAGVDPEIWRRPTDRQSSRRILIFDKKAPSAVVDLCRAAADEQGFAVTVVSYGGYNWKTYRDGLAEVDAMVYLSSSESQGIAMFEAWAMDVPTFVYEREKQGSSAMLSPSPYLCEETGAFFTERNELEKLLESLANGRSAYAPRNWIERNGTDVASVRRLISLIDDPQLNGRVPGLVSKPSK